MWLIFQASAGRQKWQSRAHYEILGQIPRLLIGGVKSFVGTIPVGNTGGANVPPLRPLPISEEIQIIFEKAGVKR